ncbi:MAG: Uma2 family endonuclease [Deltaproteobacteria bacterium]|nr:Uma2 family endonuclease [Deltaproteobacteria bacterium]MDQ3297060.1 Uma2 family endonuclease [Myxococcota bacterium]
MSHSARRNATLKDFWAIPEAQRFHELIGGELSEKAAPSGEHGDAQAGIVGAVRSPYHRGSGNGGPGGWWIATEVEVLLENADVVRPDVIGWRRDHCPERPTGFPVTVRPDWICEVVSPGHATDDTVKKLRLYHRAGITHYWLVDPRDCTLTVMRWSADGYVTRLRAVRGEVVRAEPFDAIELAVGTLFGDDPPA